MKDKSFDGIAAKFDKNIYGTTKGQLRHELITYHLTPFLEEKRGGYALDAGGGTGEFTRELLLRDYHVLLNDSSQDTLELAKTKFQSETNVTYHLGELQGINTVQQFDLVICHAVLEWLADPFSSIDHLLSLAANDSILSFSFFNKDANVFGNLLYGNFELVKNNMQQKNRLRLADHKPLEPKKILQYLEAKDCEIQFTSGIRCFHDYLRDKSQQSSHFSELKEMELLYGAQEPFKWLGKYFLIVVKKP